MMLRLIIPKLEQIFIIPPVGANPPPAGGYKTWNKAIEVVEARLVNNKGIVGDRFFGVEKFKMPNGNLKFFGKSRNVSLISLDVLNNINIKFKLSGGDIRRNLVVSGINLESLVDKNFKIGNVEFLGVDVCKGCKHIEEINNIKGLAKELFFKGGIRAKVLNDGVIKIGDFFYKSFS